MIIFISDIKGHKLLCFVSFLHFVTPCCLFALTSRLATVVDRLDARHTWRQQRAAVMEEAGAMGIYESCVSVLPNFSQVGGASDQQRGMGQ